MPRKIVAGKCHLTPMNQAGAIKQRKTFPTGQRVFTKRDSQLQRLLEKLLLSIEFRPKFLQDHDRGTQLSQTRSKVRFGEII